MLRLGDGVQIGSLGIPRGKRHSRAARSGLSRRRAAIALRERRLFGRFRPRHATHCATYRRRTILRLLLKNCVATHGARHGVEESAMRRHLRRYRIEPPLDALLPKPEKLPLMIGLRLLLRDLVILGRPAAHPLVMEAQRLVRLDLVL